MKRIGLTVGKFMPLHKGHEFMLDIARTQLDELRIIVGGKETDVIPLSVRVGWLKKKFQHDPSVTIIEFEDSIPPSKLDKDGTAVDDSFWNSWLDVFRLHSKDLTHFVSSDLYGQKAADLLNVEWLPIDPRRETYNISGTKIRLNWYQNFAKISDVAKPYFSKTVAIIGPESTGKSTLTEYLAELFSTVGAHEWGRTICETKRGSLTRTDFLQIASVQDEMIRKLKTELKPVIFTDTEAYTTYLFGQIYLNEDILDIKDIAIGQKIDLYLLLKPTVKWINDGSRVVSKQENRETFYKSLKEFLDTNNKPYVVIDNPKFYERELDAIKAVEDLLK